MSPSPLSVVVAMENSHEHAAMEPTPLSLNEFTELLPSAISQFDKGVNLPSQSIVSGSYDDPVMLLFKRLNLVDGWWKKFALVDPSRTYNRNLVATDQESFALILMCWNPDHESPIHNHPCKGCWVRVIEGSIQEHRYVEAKEQSSGGIESEDGTRLILVSEGTLHENQATFIKDSQGYHKLGNPSSDKVAFTLHLYCPPYQTCTYWLDLNGKPLQGTFPLYSEYGRILNA